MKTVFTKTFFKYFLPTFLFTTLLVSGSYAQVSHHITVSDFEFSPSSLTINVGDTVIWTNIEGVHNVDGTTGFHPDNPQSFGNAPGEDWVFSHVFVLPGVYSYHCEPHFDIGMVGNIIVEQGTSGLNDLSGIDKLSFSPNPTKGSTLIDMSSLSEYSLSNAQLVIYDITGRVLKRVAIENAKDYTLDISDLSDGVLLLKVLNNNSVILQGKLIKQ